MRTKKIEPATARGRLPPKRPKLRQQTGEFEREYGLQQSVAAAPDRLARGKPVQPLGSRVPEFDRATQTPSEHWLVGQHNQASQTFRIAEVALGSAGWRSILKSTSRCTAGVLATMKVGARTQPVSEIRSVPAHPAPWRTAG